MAKEGKERKRKRMEHAKVPARRTLDDEGDEEIRSWRQTSGGNANGSSKSGDKGATKYSRGDKNVIRKIKDKKLKMQIKRSERDIREAAAKAARAEILLPAEAGHLEAEGMEKTHRFQQKDIKQAVDIGSSKKIYTLRLEEFGPYSFDYSRSGRYLLLGGKLGHLAVCDLLLGNAMCFGTHVELWKDALSERATSPYMTHHTKAKQSLACPPPADLEQGMRVKDVYFRPFEDVLGISHSHGFSSILVPGSGEPNFDSFEANPFQNKKQRREAEIHALLEKLDPDMISLNPNFIGNVDTYDKDVIAEERRLAREENLTERQRQKKEKRHARGRDRAGKRYKKKQFNVIEERKEDARRHIAGKKEDKEDKEDKEPVGVLDRFRVKLD
ncbi:hypothetical protein GUITHDRAFT_141699 [Guillardia theta CCMP2712]|uniref:BING4 C-terminal domain-containing protein n=1 Tax=Guillardia theta (strain CCMP2712) TaxID=905079 RepID=L1J1L4_GUITC|nr:hypothetical protein GUITHDRAFT_141699 [Guillardia theta CCMP2712]EKX41975.1 hypothetical protein GUITHDRAFT_141699 [Guillardia theta CCMP2712]|eukprot:XP_005828955.1 hypothetical protein GUITHDRAFT_141699 [Guillardia theta CCMP2712]